MGKYYENLSDLIDLIKKAEKKNNVAEFILSCIATAKDNPDLSPHEIIKISKKKWNL
jgi:hypothetical protein